MDTQDFLAEFGQITTAPGGVTQLRKLILQLAVSGRLTERVEGDTPAAVLVAQNQMEQERLIAQGLLKRQHPPTDIEAKIAPWPLPNQWEWSRLGAVTNYGDAPKVEYDQVGASTWVLELEDIEKGTSTILRRVLAEQRRFKSTKNAFSRGSVLYAKLRPYLDKVVTADHDGVCTTEISPISFFRGIEAGYLRWYLKCPYFIEYANNSTHGMNLPRLGTNSG